MPDLTRGPLPARVYWVRRSMVLGTAVLLVVAIARLLGGGSDGSDGADTAQLAADTPTSSTPSTTATTPTATTSTGTKGKKGKKKAAQAAETSAAPVLAEPSGPCASSDIEITPKVATAVAGRDVMVVLQLRSTTTEACTWQVSPKTLTVDITSGKDRIWSSLDCRRAIPRREVVVRSAVTTKVGVVWKEAKRSGERCTVGTEWALPGWYHVHAAALGGEPANLQFELTTPAAATVTRTATPTQSPSAKATTKAKPSTTSGAKPSASATQQPTKKPTQKSTKKPSRSPSGAVEPNG